MGNIQSLDDFIRASRYAHGDKYSYENVDFNNDHDKVVIICPIHGEFEQRPKHHILGSGCRRCASIEARSSKKTYGVGINDLHQGKTPSYIVWHDMIRRCYGDGNNKPAYKQAKMCDEWLILSAFDEWFNNPSNGWHPHYQLDKDLLVKGNMIYSPETCCFLPQRINLALMTCKTRRNNLPIGVEKAGNRFKINCSANPTKDTFLSIEDAFNEYKHRKESFIRSLAHKYYSDNRITKKVYNALMNWAIEMTD